MSRLDEAKVREAAAWVEFDVLKSEIENFKNQTIITLGRMLKKAVEGQARAKAIRALPKTKRRPRRPTL